MPTRSLKVGPVIPDPVPSREGQGWKHQAVSMQKWEHSLMQREGREKGARTEEGGSEKRSGGKEKKEMERREQKRERRKNEEEMGNEEVEESRPSLEGKREEDRSRWRGGCQELTLCPVPCSLALYAAHPHPGEPAGGRQAACGEGGNEGGGERRTPGKEGNTPMAQGTDGHGTHEERQGRGI